MNQWELLQLQLQLQPLLQLQQFQQLQQPQQLQQTQFANQFPMQQFHQLQLQQQLQQLNRNTALPAPTSTITSLPTAHEAEVDAKPTEQSSQYTTVKDSCDSDNSTAKTRSSSQPTTITDSSESTVKNGSSSQSTTITDSESDKSTVKNSSSSKVVESVTEAKKPTGNKSGANSKAVKTVTEAKKPKGNKAGANSKVVDNLSQAKTYISQDSADNIFKLSSSSDSDDEDDDLEVFDVPTQKRKTDSQKEEGLPVKRVRTYNKCGRKNSKGRPPGSKNIGPKKSTLLQNLAKLQADGSASIINIDDSSSASDSRTLRSGHKVSTQSAADHKSSKLQSVNIGFDFDVKKSIDPEIQENLEACIVTTTTSWEDVIGLDDVKRGLKEAAVLPLLRPDLFVGFRKPPKGILLYGPPGTGKTMLGKCAASAANSTFFSITASDIMSKWLGDGEKRVAALFHLAEKKQPSIIFIDEVDSLLTSRREGEHDAIRRMKTEFLAKWEGLTNSPGRVLVIGATNRPMDLDAAALRRFSNHLYVPLPEREARKKMFQKFGQNGTVAVSLSPSDISILGCESTGYSAADITNVIHDAAMLPLRKFSFEECVKVKVEELDPVTKDDIVECLRKRRPTCDPDLILELTSWAAGVKG